jgi:undecaprenyl-diphosphatase
MAWIAPLLGVVEGLTEFLPISSTGHLILTNALVGFDGPLAKLFTIFIQLGAILAVVWEYRARLGAVARDLPRSAAARSFAFKLLLAFLPSAFLGLLVEDLLDEHLFHPLPVALALFVGGVLILLVERFHRERAPAAARDPASEASVDSIDWYQALRIGLAQCLALWPGFSRSAATILGGLSVGLDRRTATEFSFFLAIPTMFAASGYKLVKNWSWLGPGDLAWLAVAFAVSFFVAWGSIRWLLRYVSSHGFGLFAWYRMALGAAILVVGF